MLTGLYQRVAKDRHIMECKRVNLIQHIYFIQFFKQTASTGVLAIYCKVINKYNFPALCNSRVAIIFLHFCVYVAIAT